MTPIEEWINALKSGKYHQGYTKLKQNNQYCCLGVAGELFGPKVGVNPTKVDHPFLGPCTTWSNKFLTVCETLPPIRECAYLDEKILEYLGISESFSNFLAEINDSGKFDFHQIAEIIKSAHKNNLTGDKDECSSTSSTTN